MTVVVAVAPCCSSNSSNMRPTRLLPSLATEMPFNSFTTGGIALVCPMLSSDQACLMIFFHTARGNQLDATSAPTPGASPGTA